MFASLLARCTAVPCNLELVPHGCSRCVRLLESKSGRDRRLTLLAAAICACVSQAEAQIVPLPCCCLLPLIVRRTLEQEAMSLALALVPTRTQTDADRRGEEGGEEGAKTLTIMMMVVMMVVMMMMMLLVSLVSLLSASIVRSSARLYMRGGWINGRHAKATTRSSEGLRPCCVRGNDALSGAQSSREGRERALTLELQNRGGLRMRKEKRRRRQVSSEDLVVLYEGAERSLERGLHSSAYEGLLHLERH